MTDQLTPATERLVHLQDRLADLEGRAFFTAGTLFPVVTTATSGGIFLVLSLAFLVAGLWAWQTLLILAVAIVMLRFSVIFHREYSAARLEKRSIEQEIDALLAREYHPPNLDPGEESGP